MNSNLQGFILFLFLVLFAVGSFLYMNYSMVKKGKEKKSKSS